jgi:hypothetical protein
LSKAGEDEDGDGAELSLTRTKKPIKEIMKAGFSSCKDHMALRTYEQVIVIADKVFSISQI